MFVLSIAIWSTLKYISNEPKVQESITFFKIDPKATFKKAETTLILTGRNTLHWKIVSSLNQKAYLRQDAGLLYENGRLMGEQHAWKQNTAALTQEKQMDIKQNAYLQAISFHHAELHEKGGQIFSSQTVSEDQIYVITEGSNTPASFHTPGTKEQTEWKQSLDEQTERMLRYSWNKGIRHFSVQLKDYQAFPLNRFNKKAKGSLPGFTKEETAEIMGRLWEGLYKNYILGIKKADGTSVNPAGSTIPLILLANNKSHLLVITETAAGEPILLRQQIPL